MIAAQKAQQEKKANEAKNNPVPASDSVDSGAAPVAAAPAAKLKFGIKKAGTTPPKGEADDKGEVRRANQSVADTPVKSEPVAGPDISGGVFSLEELENVTAEGIESSGKEPSRGIYAFADEIPATAPTRELPEELTDGMKAFVTSLDSIYEIVHDAELFGQMIRTIMQELQENPEYTKLLADQDVHTMLRGLRSSMGLAKIKKAEKATKTRGSKAAPKTAALASTAEAMFNDTDW